MKISQMARNQNMMYKIINKNSGYASQLRTRLPDFGLVNSVKSGNKISSESLLRNMGLNGLKGRTVRDMA